MQQDEYSTARPTLKRLINGNPTAEPRRTRLKAEHRAPTNLIEGF